MKKIVTLLLLAAFLPIASSCTADKVGTNEPYTQTDNNLEDPLNTTDANNSLEQLFEADKSNESNSDKMELQTTIDLKGLLSGGNILMSPEVISLFCTYYYEHPYELRYLPQFMAGETPDWDELSFYVFNVSCAESPVYEGYVAKDDFKNVVLRYFDNLSYKDTDSQWVTFVEGKYIPTGWDTTGSVFYRLTNISKDECSLFTASFDGIAFSELDFTEDYESSSPNMRAVMEVMGIENPTGALQSTREKIAKMLTNSNYAEVFLIEEHVTISFRLAGEANDTFVYVSCNRYKK